MMFPATKHSRKDLNVYATAADFCAVFKAHSDDLYQLAFLLTADHEKAEQCFVAGLEDSVTENHVFKEWTHSWAKRAILRNAIRELKPRPSAYSSSRVHAPQTSPISRDRGEHFEAGAILALERFERFAFVISVLEQYSEHECSLLLGCAPWEIREARSRALTQLASSQGEALPDAASSGLRAEPFITPDDGKVAVNQ
jgi:DNA-directed RNA polymerase specialized sigma24 family protein